MVGKFDLARPTVGWVFWLVIVVQHPRIQAQYTLWHPNGCEVTSTDPNPDCCQNALYPCGENEGGCSDNSHCHANLECKPDRCLDQNGQTMAGVSCCVNDRKPIDTCYEKDMSYWHYDLNATEPLTLKECDDLCQGTLLCWSYIVYNKICYMKAYSHPADWGRQPTPRALTHHRYCKPKCWFPDVESRQWLTSYQFVSDFDGPEHCQELCRLDERCFSAFIFPFPLQCILREFDHFPVQGATGLTLPPYCVEWDGDWGSEERIGGTGNTFGVIESNGTNSLEVCLQAKGKPVELSHGEWKNLFSFMVRYKNLIDHTNYHHFFTATQERHDLVYTFHTGRGLPYDSAYNKYICHRATDECYLKTLVNADIFLPFQPDQFIWQEKHSVRWTALEAFFGAKELGSIVADQFVDAGLWCFLFRTEIQAVAVFSPTKSQCVHDPPKATTGTCRCGLAASK